MYAFIGLPRLLKGLALLAAGVAVLNFVIRSAMHQSALTLTEKATLGWLSATLGVAVCMGVVAAGQLAVFPWLCRKTIMGRWFPAVEGVWTGSLESNIGVIAARDPELAGQVKGNIIPAEILVKARLLSVSVALRSRPLNAAGPYQTSDTITADVQRIGSAGRIQLAYVFKAEIATPLKTDTTMHIGAAVLILSEINGIRVFEGDYCTNRNWQVARNTAGRASFTYSSPITTWPTSTTMTAG